MTKCKIDVHLYPDNSGRNTGWGILTFAETGKTFVLETMGITELNIKAIIDEICAI